MAEGLADALAKKAAEEVPLDDNEKWMSGGGIRQWTKNRKMEYVEDKADGEAVIKRAMGWERKAVTNYFRLRGGKGTNEPMVGLQSGVYLCIWPSLNVH